MLERAGNAGEAARKGCVFSCTQQMCLTLDQAGVPPDDKWRTLVLYMRGLKDHDYLSAQQKKQVQDILLQLIRTREYTEKSFQHLIKKIENILSAPYIKKLEETSRESARLLLEFKQLLQKNSGDIHQLQDTTIGAIESGKEPQELIADLRVAFHGVVASMQDNAARLDLLSKTDGLTRLYNRRAFDDFLRDRLADSRSSGRSLSLLILDIDHFKKFNDSYGHLIGDQALITVAKILTQALSTFSNEDGLEYFGARYGGEEFVVVIPEASLAAALARAETIRTKIAEYNFIIRDNMGNVVHKDIRITASIGVAEVIREDAAAIAEEVIIGHADQALYRAKANGRNQVCSYQSSLPS